MHALAPTIHPVADLDPRATPLLTLRCFGPRLQLWSRGQAVELPGRERLRRATLALLGLAGPNGLSIGRMVRAFPQAGEKLHPRTEAMNISRAHTSIFRLRADLREILGPGRHPIIVLTGSKTYALNPSLVDCDGFRYLRLLDGIAAGGIAESLAAFNEARALLIRGVLTDESFGWLTHFPTGEDTTLPVEEALGRALRRAVESRLTAVPPGSDGISLAPLHRWLENGAGAGGGTISVAQQDMGDYQALLARIEQLEMRLNAVGILLRG